MSDASALIQNKIMKHSTRWIGRLVIYAILIIFSTAVLVPFLWMLSTSLKTEMQVYDFPIKWIPNDPQWVNYLTIWSKISFLTYYLNTIKLTLVITLLQLITSSLAAYAFAKIKFPESKYLFLGYIATLMVPYPVIMIPQFILCKKLHLVDTHWALILLLAFSPYGVFLLRQFFLTIPDEFSEAARIDGLSDFGICSKIIIPLSKPALTSLAIFVSVFVWNDFLGPLIYLNTDSKKTIQLGIRYFMMQYGSTQNLIMAASVVSLIPIILLFISAQRFFVEGITLSGIKG